MENDRYFLQFLNKILPLTEDEYHIYIKPHVLVRHFKKRQIISAAGEVESHFNFITKGLVRKYLKRDKDEINVQVSIEGHMILADESFYTRVPSEYVVEAIEPTTVVSILHDDMEKIFAANSKMERMGRLLVTFALVLKNRWQMNMIKLTPRERFLNLVNKNPELLQRVPQKYLASFLNIQTETFSRFKHMLKEKI